MTKAGELILENQTDAILSSDERRDRYVKWDPFIACLRCGVCCTRFQVRLDLSEARRICDRLGLSWYTFLGNYIEPHCTGSDTFLLRQQDGMCVFLKRTNEPHRTICLIHAWKPSACREWTPSLYRRECQEGLLLEQWGLTVTPEGELQGSDEGIQHFQLFLESLKKVSTYSISGKLSVVAQHGNS
jgi:hypothetical protein